jgi:hypothetical protein
MEMPKEKKSWYSRYYHSGWHWVEDTYLKYFGENRTSYGIKGKAPYLLLELSEFCYRNADPPKTPSTRQKSRAIKTWIMSRETLEIASGIYLQPDTLGELWDTLWIRGL